MNQCAHVAVLGPRAAEKLFGKANPVGREIKLNQLVFRIIGTFKSKGAEGFMNEDDNVMLPFTTVQRLLVGRAPIGIDLRRSDVRRRFKGR